MMCDIVSVCGLDWYQIRFGILSDPIHCRVYAINIQYFHSVCFSIEQRLSLHNPPPSLVQIIPTTQRNTIEPLSTQGQQKHENRVMKSPQQTSVPRIHRKNGNKHDLLECKWLDLTEFSFQASNSL